MKSKNSHKSPKITIILLWPFFVWNLKSSYFLIYFQQRMNVIANRIKILWKRFSMIVWESYWEVFILNLNKLIILTFKIVSHFKKITTGILSNFTSYWIHIHLAKLVFKKKPYCVVCERWNRDWMGWEEKKKYIKFMNQFWSSQINMIF